MKRSESYQLNLAHKVIGSFTKVIGPESGLVADARLQPTSGGKAIPTKSVISLNALACERERPHARVWRADIK